MVLRKGNRYWWNGIIFSEIFQRMGCGRLLDMYTIWLTPRTIELL